MGDHNSTVGGNDSVRAETTPCADATRANAEDRAPTPRRSKDYRVICISIYDGDLAALDERVKQLKQAGWTKANRSHLIRIAVSELTDEQLAEIALLEKGRR